MCERRISPDDPTSDESSQLTDPDDKGTLAQDQAAQDMVDRTTRAFTGEDGLGRPPLSGIGG